MTEKYSENIRNIRKTCDKRTGGCLCGGVRFVVEADAPRETTLRPLVACHCRQCRKTSGTFVVATKIATKHLSFQTQETLVWYRSSQGAQRGFCSRCGASLFYRRRAGKDQPQMQHEQHQEAWSVMLGALDQACDLPFAGHIFTAGAHPMLAHLSTTPQSKGWAEQPLIEKMHEQGWHDTKSLTTPPPNKQHPPQRHSL